MDLIIEKKSNFKVITLIGMVFIALSYYFIYSKDVIAIDNNDIIKVDYIQENRYFEVTANIRPIQSISISAIANARVKQIHVTNGQHVKIGQALLEYESKALQNEYEKEALSLELEEVNLLGEQAKHEQQLYELQNTFEVSKINLSEANVRLAAYKALISGGGYSKLDYKNAEFTAEKAQKMVENRKAILDFTRKSVAAILESTKKKISIQRSTLNMLHNKLEQLTLIASRDGIIAGLNLEQGDVVEDGNIVLKINDTSNYTFEVSIPDHRYSEVNVGSNVTIYLENEKILAKLTKITNDVSNGYVSAFASPVDTLQRDLPLGHTVKAKIYLNETINLLKIKNPKHYRGDPTVSLYTRVDNKASFAFLKEYTVFEQTEKYILLEVEKNAANIDQLLDLHPEFYSNNKQIKLGFSND